MTALTINQLHQKVELLGIKGFLADDEAEALFHFSSEAGRLAPCLEVGSYCGKSTVYIASACKLNQSVLYAIDHHRGSEEHQLGEAYHDSELYNQQLAVMDSFPKFREALSAFQLESSVIPIVASSELVARHWVAPLGLVFIDGGHSDAVSLQDCLNWAKHIVIGGILAVHDIFEHPEEGGQGPYIGLNAVLQSGDFVKLQQVNSLGLLKKIR